MRSSLSNQNVTENAQISRIDLNEDTLDGSSDDQKQKLEFLDSSGDDEWLRHEKAASQSSQQEYFVVTDGGPTNASINETTVDIVAVPCPGVRDRYSTWIHRESDPPPRNSKRTQSRSRPRIRSHSRSWNRDRSRSFLRQTQTHPPALTGPENAVLEPVSVANVATWVREGIRSKAREARILLARHPDLTDTTTLEDLADVLLEKLQEKRQGETPRPLFFMCHSIGGLVVKTALAKARKSDTYRSIFSSCYGIGFFATPHRGSNYLSMPDVAESIKDLLGLQTELGPKLRSQVYSESPTLLALNDDFKKHCSDMQIWTFYETIDSAIKCRPATVSRAAPGSTQPAERSNDSGGSHSRTEFSFSGFVTPVRFAILGTRQEKIFPLQTDHARCASIGGQKNERTNKSFLEDLSAHIRKAAQLSVEQHHEMDLYRTVKVEVHGYYQDGPSDAPATIKTATAAPADTHVIRPWSNRVPLESFLEKGPQKCLEEGITMRGPKPGNLLYMPPHKSEPNMYEAYIAGEAAVATLVMNATEDIHDDLERTVDSQVAALSEQMPRRSDSAVIRPSTLGLQQRSLPPKSDQDFLDRLQVSLDATVTRMASTRKQSGGAASTDVSEDAGLDKTAKRWRLRRSDGSQRGSRRIIDRPQTKRWGHTSGGLGGPDPQAQKYLWIHMASNNPTWVEEVMHTLKDSEPNVMELLNQSNWASHFNKGRHDQHYASFMRPTVALLPMDLDTPIFKDPVITVLLPYLHYDLYPASVRRRQLIRKRLKRGRCRPVPDTVTDIGSTELKTIWEYLGYELPINCRRTLDQFRYPTLHDTRARDDDQMLYKMTKQRDFSTDAAVGHHVHAHDPEGNSAASSLRLWPGRDDAPLQMRSSVRRKKKKKADDDGMEQTKDLLGGNVLMVDQLWMWVIGPKTLVTFFPRRESDRNEGPLYRRCDLRDNIFNDANSDGSTKCHDAYDMAALVVLHSVTVLLERPSYPELEVFRLFEEAIGILTEKLTTAMKKFRTSRTDEHELIYEAEFANEGSIRKRYLEENDRIERENRDSTSALLELRDLEDELSTISTLLAEQIAHVDKLHKNFKDINARDKTHGRRASNYIADALEKLNEYSERANTMSTQVKTTRDEYDKLLMMQQQRAQISEVRLQRLQADLASAQGRSVLIFTTFTVIFLPLSFFTSLFGMNTREWQRQLPTFREVGLISLPISAFVIFLTLLVAWSTHTRLFFTNIGKLLVALVALVVKVWVEVRMSCQMMLRPPANGAHDDDDDEEDEGDDDADNELTKRQRSFRRDGTGESFWGNSDLKGEDNYKIPDNNWRPEARINIGRV